MGLHKEFGLQGESLAGKYFEDRGHIVLARNWRYLRCEIDLITVKDGVVHIVEVKARQTQTFGYPEESVNKRKLKCMIKAGTEFMRRNPQWKRVQYDILSIFVKNNKPEYYLIEDVYLYY